LASARPLVVWSQRFQARAARPAASIFFVANTTLTDDGLMTLVTARCEAINGANADPAQIHSTRRRAVHTSPNTPLPAFMNRH
jgi:hypothetical protein